MGRIAALLLTTLTALLASACGGPLGHRQSVPMKGDVAIGPDVRKVRLHGDAGTFLIRPGNERKLSYGGVLLLAASSAEDLAALLKVNPAPTATPAADGVLDIALPSAPPGELALRTVAASELIFELPPDLALDIEFAGSSKLHIRDWQAPIRSRIGRGHYDLGNCTGATDLDTKAGQVMVEKHSGDLFVKTGGGDCRVTLTRPGEHVRLQSGAGNINCFVPADTGFRLDGRTEEGRVTNGFGIPGERVLEFGAVMKGEFGDGRTAITMKTGKGSLALSHRTFR